VENGNNVVRRRDIQLLWQINTLNNLLVNMRGSMYRDRGVGQIDAKRRLKYQRPSMSLNEQLENDYGIW
jgi:hypothetical protein